MKQETESSAYYPEQRSMFDLRIFFHRNVRKWYWYVITISIGIIGAYLYNGFAPPKYNIHSSLIVNEYESGIRRLSLFQEPNNDQNINVLDQDHAGRLKSFTISLNTLQSLGWNISWYQKTPLYGKDLYKNEPYEVVLTPDKKNLKNTAVFITSLSESEFQADARIKTDSFYEPVTISQKGRFGEPFENNYFNFTLRKPEWKPVNKVKLYFVINDLNKLALKYQKKLNVVSNEKKPDLIKLILSEENCERGVDYLNRLEQTYIDYGLEEKNRVAENTMKFIDSQLKSVTDSLSDSEDRFTRFRTRTQAVNINTSGGIVMQKKESLESERAALENRLEYLRKLRSDLNISKRINQVVLPSAFGITDPTLNTLVAKLSDLYSRREVLSFSVQDKAPSLLLLDKEIHFTYNIVAQNIDFLLYTTRADLENLNHRTWGFDSQLSILPKTEQQLSYLKRSFDLNNELYTFLLKKRAESAITYASNQPDVKMLDTAKVETAIKISPIALINYSVGILAGFLFSFTVILFNEFINRSIQTKQEVEEMINIPVLGTILHNKSKVYLAVLDNPKSNISESFRLLRTNLKVVVNGNDKKVIAVQSTVTGEGKSFISLNLATILALNNYNVLLVGVDMRMSNLHKILKSDNSKGLSSYLGNQNHFEDIVVSTPVSNLSFIASGPVPPNPVELLENGKFDRFLNEAKSRYDYIILDCPPVALVTDGFITGHYADVNLFVIRFRYSDKENLKLINEQLNNKTLPNLFLVLNDAVKENFGYVNYYDKRYKGYYEK